jgi:hypothetical protein
VCAQVVVVLVVRIALVSSSSWGVGNECRLAAQCASTLGANAIAVLLFCCNTEYSGGFVRKFYLVVLSSVGYVVAQGGTARTQANDVGSVTSSYRTERQMRGAGDDFEARSV